MSFLWACRAYFQHNKQFARKRSNIFVCFFEPFKNRVELRSIPGEKKKNEGLKAAKQDFGFLQVPSFGERET